MKKFCFLLYLISIVRLSCSSLPVIEPVDLSEFKKDLNPFVNSKYSFTHSIRAELPNGDKLLVIGVTIADPKARTINAVLMTVEGFVLFDISYKDETILINRSVPPFDSSAFANSLIDDIELIYFIPESNNIEHGRLNRSFIKRYRCNDGTTVDIIALNDEIIEIIKYNSSCSLMRTVNILSINKENIPEAVELIAHGFFGYTLYLELIDFERL